MNQLETKEKILASIKAKGPSLPVHVAKTMETNLIFAGAFLSQLASEKEIKISNMKVGGSPLYYLPGQEQDLEKFYTYLHGKEKDAFLMLKDKKILQDSGLEPAIRVALRGIKDFAFPIIAKENDVKHIFWRFHSLPESEAIESIKQLNPFQQKVEIIDKERELGENIISDIKKEKSEISSPESRFELLHPELAEKPKIEEKVIEVIAKPELPVTIEEKPKKAKILKDAFLQDVQNILTKKNLAIIKVEYFDKKEVILRALDKQELLVFAFNKKKINDKELIKAYKKALSLKLPYIIMIKDDISRKMKESIDASKSLLRVERLE